MRNTHRSSASHILVFLFFFFHLFACFSPGEGTGKIHSRRLLASSVTSFSANLGEINGAMVEPEKAVENGLRKKPPSASNPIQNNGAKASCNW
nr:Lipoyltransferase 2 isoform 1 [Ipomoea batatas]